MDTSSLFSILGSITSGHFAYAVLLILIALVVYLVREINRLNELVKDKDKLAREYIQSSTDLFEKTMEELFNDGKANREMYQEALRIFERLTTQLLTKTK